MEILSEQATQILTPEEVLLKQTRKRGEVCIYRLDKIDGQPLTMHWMVEALQLKFDQAGWGRILFGPSLEWCQDQAFFMEDTPRPGLALVSREPIPGSTNQNHWRQTELLARLVGDVYKKRKVPDLYRDALTEWGEDRDRLNRILTSDWQGAAKGLAGLLMNELFREKPVESLCGVLIPFMNTGERRLVDLCTWTNAISSDGRLVYFGRFTPGGAGVVGWDPRYGRPYLGVCSNRSIL